MGASLSQNFKSSLYSYYHNNELIDYINSTEYTNYYRNIANNSVYGVSGVFGLSKSCVSNLKYYKLYIYINPDVNSKIIRLYQDDADKKNALIDSYLEAKNNENSICQDFCFDAGFDLYNTESIVSNSCQSIIVDYNIQCAMKVCINGIERYVGYYLYCRSSTGSKTPLRLSNSVGIIDSGYRGNIKACFDNNNINNSDINNYDIIVGSNDFVLKQGERYVQLCPPNLEYPMKVVIVDNISDLGNETIRGEGGFGSSGQ
tara:strand:- start:3827 stop:4603 length:777 start_codon:yes stop_codon:yes gene_type:complete